MGSLKESSTTNITHNACTLNVSEMDKLLVLIETVFFFESRGRQINGLAYKKKLDK